MTLFTFYFHAFLRASAAVLQGFGFCWRVLTGSRKYLSVGGLWLLSVLPGDRWALSSDCNLYPSPDPSLQLETGEVRRRAVPSVRVPRCSSRWLSLLLAPGTLQQLGHLSHTTTIPTTTAAPYVNISASLSS